MTRRVSRLRKALRLQDWPPEIPKPRPRGVKAFGQRYEKLVEKQIPEAKRGIWWEFVDDHGPGLCQTDFLVHSASIAAILECKNTYTQDAFEQLAWLYIPVVTKALGLPVIGIHICKNLVPEARGPICYDLVSAINLARETNTVVTVHWRGVTPLLKSPTHSKGVSSWPSNTVGAPLQQVNTYPLVTPSGPRL